MHIEMKANFFLGWCRQVVEGDIGEEGLGLSEQDREMVCSQVRMTCAHDQYRSEKHRTLMALRQVTLILHMAATTRFTEHIQLAIQMNTLGGLRVLRLAKQCPHLRALGKLFHPTT